ncbi:MAG: helix-turn-helix domain-containing protein [Faecalispora sporosphaeroides]|uniref:helix-turn-helix domain-containing protein n=1 Tax=Faecalispora sporosphaeroides TaxID=1549 RepID=UPI003990EADB
MKINYSVGMRVKELRIFHGLSQEQLALHSEITPAYLGQIERSEKKPTVYTIEKICSALDISLSNFFSDQSFSNTEEDTVLKQISLELKNCSTEEKQEILQIIRHAMKLRQL